VGEGENTDVVEGEGWRRRWRCARREMRIGLRREKTLRRMREGGIDRG